MFSYTQVVYTRPLVLMFSCLKIYTLSLSSYNITQVRLSKPLADKLQFIDEKLVVVHIAYGEWVQV